MNMAAKQFSQTLTHPNAEIPFVISDEWRNLSKTSGIGIQYAKDNGSVIYNKNDLMIVY